MSKVITLRGAQRCLCAALVACLCSLAQNAQALAHNVSCQPNCPAGTSSNNPKLDYDPEDQSCLPVTRGTAPNTIICVEVHDDDDGEKDGEACCMPDKKLASSAADFADQIISEIAK